MRPKKMILVLLAAGAAAMPAAPLRGRRADPSSSWMSYAKFDAGDIITQMNVTVVVPDK